MNAPHRHFAIQVVVGLDDGVSWWTPELGECAAPGVIIPPNTVHSFPSHCGPVAALYLSPVSRLGRAALAESSECARPIQPLAAQAIREILLRAGDHEDIDSERMEQLLSNRARAVPADRRLSRLLEFLHSQSELPHSAADLSRLTLLSASRASHLFASTFYTAFRPYVRFVRLQRAMFGAMAGQTLTDAAATAGFSDASHFDRTFKQHTGCTPTLLAKTLTVSFEQPTAMRLDQPLDATRKTVTAPARNAQNFRYPTACPPPSRASASPLLASTVALVSSSR